mmetsp:Transcript_13468/g.48998  ORF Transcript_13468/g.48998 Transcript_13468/m.48998 type:complete len:751 (-) Transcript_13468:191-2443(-)
MKLAKETAPDETDKELSSEELAEEEEDGSDFEIHSQESEEGQDRLEDEDEEFEGETDEDDETDEGSGEEDAEGESDEDAEEDDPDEVDEALAEYMAEINAEQHRKPSWHELEDPGSDSSEDEREQRNTVGNVPLEWYKDEEHIGYDRDGNKIVKGQKKDELDKLLERQDDPKAWRTIYDEYNDEHVVLSREEIELIQRMRKGMLPYARTAEGERFDEGPYFTWVEHDGQPLVDMPEPKRRFIPSKWEAKKVVKLVRALRKGWIKPKEKESVKDRQPPTYLMWSDDNKVAEKTAVNLPYIAAPKPTLPGHEQSYNPPTEYLLSAEEEAAAQRDEEHPFLPKAYDSLRKVPAYGRFLHERFERCLDLYLCPRTRKNRVTLDPESLLPKLPKARDLRPYPHVLYDRLVGHTGPVLALDVDPRGELLASGSSDCTLRVWETRTGRCRNVWTFRSPVTDVAWNPQSGVRILLVAAGKEVMLVDGELCPSRLKGPVRTLKQLEGGVNEVAKSEADGTTWCKWQSIPDQQAELWGNGMQIIHDFTVKTVSWHSKGDYFATVAPSGQSKSVLIHQLSRRMTQCPFRKNKGQVVHVLFHPSRPMFFLATERHIRVYNLLKQSLVKKLTPGVRGISCMSIHPGGDNLLVGSNDAKVCWFDLDLSVKPYKSMAHHRYGVRGVAYHNSYPLFATTSDDGTAQVFHGMVYADLMQNPLLVPLKILRDHTVVDSEGVTACVFHPHQPWLYTAGADRQIMLWCEV